MARSGHTSAFLVASFVAAVVLVSDACANSTRATLDAGPSPETDNPTIPVGYDAYRMWDRWPYLRLAMRTYMRSTYNRAGGNDGSDASHFLRVTASRAVALDVTGTGLVSFERFNHWHGSPWHEMADGQDAPLAETNTATPTAPSSAASFVPETGFPPPLAWTWPATRGADVVGIPMPFLRSFEVDYERTHYGTGYFIYSLFPPGSQNVSHALATFAPGAPPAEIVDLLDRAGQDIAPPPSTPGMQSLGGELALPAGGAVTVFDAAGPATLRALTFTLPTRDAAGFASARLRVTWDDRATPSIDAPVPLFFGSGSLYDRAQAEYLVKAFPVSIRFAGGAGGTVSLAAYFPMPFFRHAHVELVGGPADVPTVTWSARTLPYRDSTNWAGYLHATFVDHGTPTPGVNLTLLDTTKVEGGGDWCGHVVGTSFIFSDTGGLPALETLEGNPRFFFDDSQTPQVQGTGTEEWGGGGDYWDGALTSTLPFFGHPVGVPLGATAQSADDGIESAYRFLLADLMPFGKNARLQFEHGGSDESTEHYRSVAYWYGLPGSCLVQTDALHVGDPADERAHDYESPMASSVDTLSSRYEWGVDHVGTVTIYPESADTGRHTSGTSEFTLAIQPKNFGVLLRRKLDYGFADQRAEVYVAADTPGAAFVHVGTWYLAGSNTCVYSNPPQELDGIGSPAPFTVETSNRRWRDDEFLLPRALTDGRSALRVRVVFAPATRDLAPGTAAPMSAWSEYRYTAYSYALPPLP